MAVKEAPGLARAAALLKNISVKGLMTMPPYSGNPGDSRPYFSALRELSMGMSGDFEVAIEEGATLVRVGTAIFGNRG
jgi:uncharacterized pyridoxal phosphate-containing UPF0001 family protein